MLGRLLRSLPGDTPRKGRGRARDQQRTTKVTLITAWDLGEMSLWQSDFVMNDLEVISIYHSFEMTTYERTYVEPIVGIGSRVFVAWATSILILKWLIRILWRHGHLSCPKDFQRVIRRLSLFKDPEISKPNNEIGLLALITVSRAWGRMKWPESTLLKG